MHSGRRTVLLEELLEAAAKPRQLCDIVVLVLIAQVNDEQIPVDLNKHKVTGFGKCCSEGIWK
jgi:hypothetical protein